MQIGLHVSSFTWPGGPPALRDNLARVAAAAEEQGFAKLSVMDHVWQIGNIGPPEQEMLEAYTALGFLAARTERIELLAWVTAVVYREPGLLAKAVTTLDVLSGGRAWLGTGAAWNESGARPSRLARPRTSPRALPRPPPPVMIGGAGERKTLRLVAQYAQACNLFF